MASQTNTQSGEYMVTTLHYSESLVRRVVTAFCRRTAGWKFVVGLAMVAPSLGIRVLQERFDWVSGVLGAALVMGVLFVSTLYIVHYRSSMGRFRRMKEPLAILELKDSGLKLSVDDASHEVSWNLVSDLWQFPEFWLLFLSPSHFITLPAVDLTHEVRQEILRYLKRSES